MAQLCLDNGVVYTINGNYESHPELQTTDYSNFAGCVGANNAQVGSLYAGWLEENASEDAVFDERLGHGVVLQSLREDEFNVVVGAGGSPGEIWPDLYQEH